MAGQVRPQYSSSTNPEDRITEIRLAKDTKLSAFRDGEGNPITLEKDERDRRINENFPSASNLDWGAALSRDTDLFARIMRDIIKLDQREPGKSGPRPNTLDFEKGLATFRTLMGEDFTTLPFRESFAVLARGYSLTHLARKVHLSRPKVHRFLRGEVQPTEYDLRAIADGFNKHPSYFVEYRRAYIIQALEDALLKEPESTIAYYQKMIRAS